jgi:hypothetical protein
MSHHTYGRMVPLQESSTQLTLHELWQRTQQDLDKGSVIEFSRDVIHKLVCRKCNREEVLFVAVGTVSYQQGRCPHDGEMRTVITTHGYSAGH